jgi:hypothetical protein
MAHDLEQSTPNFDGSERMYLEKPAEIALVSSGSVTCYVEVWGHTQRNLPFTRASDGVKFGGIQIVVTTTPSSLAYLAQQAGYNIGLPPSKLLAHAEGIPDGAVGGCLLVDASALSSVAYNVAGTADGSGAYGIDPNRAGPIPLGPRVLPAGGLLTFGGFIQ